MANAVLLPYTLESYNESVYNKLKKLAVEIKIADKNTEKEVAAKAFIEMIRKMNANMGIADKLKGIREEDIPSLAIYADKEANPLYPVPKLMNAKELQKLYYSVMED